MSMFRFLAPLATVCFLGSTAPSLAAWGTHGHRLVAAAALKDLPPELASWFAGQEATVVDHVCDPDLWKLHDPLEGPRHFLDCEAYGGPGAVPLDEDAARAQLGAERFQQNGQVPWVILERMGRLSRAFQGADAAQVALEAAILCHYVGDLSVPLHTTSNHNGDETGQHGVHGRWEAGLVERIEAREGWLPEVRQAESAPFDGGTPWAWLRDSYALVAGVLADDVTASNASAGLGRVEELDRAYWRVFLSLQEPVVKEQLTVAGQRTAQMILWAWAAAGQPPAPGAGVDLAAPLAGFP